MRFYGTKYVFLIIITVLLLFSVNILSAKDTKKIMIVHSYNSQYMWVKEYTSGLKDGFEKYGLSKYNLIIKNFYMNAKRYPELLKKKGEQAYSVYRDFKPDLIIAADDAAQKFFIVPYVSNRVRTPVVFLGVKADPSVYGYPSKNVTGVLEELNFLESLILVHMLSPSSKTYGIISDESITARILVKERLLKERLLIENVLPFFKFKVLYSTNDFEKWKKYVKKLQQEVDVIYLLCYFSLKDRNGNYLDPEIVLSWYLKNSKKPEATPLIFTVKEGVLCSYGESSYIQGMNAAKIVSDILVKKLNVKNISIVKPKQALRAINRKRAKELGIEIPEELIPGTVFYD